MDEVHGFGGPLFVVGMPRSGTKLLRNMLNQHPRIRFSEIETEFFPRWASQIDKSVHIEDEERFRKFYEECLRLPFFSENAARGITVRCEEWYRCCHTYTAGGVFEALMKNVLHIRGNDNQIIWGDKSPSYIRHLPLLFQYFPQAKVIHLVRDVRDYCLSANNAWGKSQLRAAQRWNDDVLKCVADGRRRTEDYMEIRYEDLLLDPEATLLAVCQFVGVTFDARALSVGPGTEEIGDAKGMSQVLQSNVRKYEERMSSKLRLRIEQIACAALREMNYPCAYGGEPVRIPAWKLEALRFWDGVALLRTSMAERGLIGAVKLHFQHWRAAPRT